MAKYFVNPFAVGGQRSTIPDPSQVSGSVSWTTGFGPDYSLDLLTDPAAKPVPRLGVNEVLYEATLALQEYQQTGVPAFITTSDNLGTPYPYAKYAQALYNLGLGAGPQIFRSLLINNVSLPSDATRWQLQPLLISGPATGTPNAITLNPAIAYGLPSVGDIVVLQISTPNTSSAAATFALGTNAPAPIVVPSRTGLFAIYAGQLGVGFAMLRWDGTNWELLNPSPTPFYSQIAFQNASFQTVPNSVVPIQWDNVVYDPNGLWDAGNFWFVIPFDGFYEITCLLYGDNPGTAGFNGLRLNQNGSFVRSINGVFLGGAARSAVLNGSTGSFFANLGDEVYVEWQNQSPTNTRIGADTSGNNGAKNLLELKYLGQ